MKVDVDHGIVQQKNTPLKTKNKTKTNKQTKPKKNPKI
jgi:hypothetical protein